MIDSLFQASGAIWLTGAGFVVMAILLADGVYRLFFNRWSDDVDYVRVVDGEIR